MAKGNTGRRVIGSRDRRASPYPLTSIDESMNSHVEDSHEITAKKDWEDATCSVCMEYPHNAVLLLCSSYDKGCRPYMCGTSFRHSNCLDQYKKHTKATLPYHSQPHHDTAEGLAIGLLSTGMDNSEAVKLPCPLCRGQVKGWTVVEPAREYLNAKKRNCMQENCSFVGTYKGLRKHVRVSHPSARPHKVDPLLKQKWRRFEHDQERDDVISTIRSSTPGAVVFGDYVIEANNRGSDSDEEEDNDANTMAMDAANDSNFMNMVMFLQGYDSAGTVSSNRVAMNPRDTNLSFNRSSVGLTPDAAIGDLNFSDQDGDSDGDIQDNGGSDGDIQDNGGSDGDIQDNDGAPLVNRPRLHPHPHLQSLQYFSERHDSHLFYPDQYGGGVRAFQRNGGVFPPGGVRALRRNGGVFPPGNSIRSRPRDRVARIFRGFR